MGLWSLLCAPERGSVVAPEVQTQAFAQPEKPASKLQVVVGTNDAAGPSECCQQCDRSAWLDHGLVPAVPSVVFR
jgi:hypothetical protein